MYVYSGLDGSKHDVSVGQGPSRSCEISAGVVRVVEYSATTLAADFSPYLVWIYVV